MVRSAPSEEFTLHCDIPGCEAALSMVSEVARSEHGWGRITIYHNVLGDYDLCAEHYRQVMDILGGSHDQGTSL